MVKINRHIFLGNATENDVGTAIDAVQLLPLIYLGSAEPSPISYIDVLLSGVSPLVLTNAIEGGLNYLKLFGGTELVPETYLDTVTLSGGCEQRNLPSGYTQIEYLESSGTQYIDTGIVLKSEATITTVGQNLQSVITGGPNSFWGFMGGTNNLPRWGWSIYQNRWLPDLNMTTGYGLASDTNKHTFVNNCYYENNVLKYNSLLDGTGTSVRAVDNVTTYTNNTLSAYLFARNNDGTAGNFLICRIFSCEIVQDSIKVLSLIPCRRNSDNVLGMYDTVTGNFLTNAGTGTFTAGSDTVPTPDYPMDIWCNNGILKASPNLFNKSLVPDVNEYINRSNGSISSPASGEFRHSDYITIKENAQYYVGIITSNANTAGLAFYDDTQTYISGLSLTELGNNNNIITSPNDTKYIRFSFRTDEGYNTDWENTVYLVEGNQPLAEFMPYGAIYTDGTVEQVTDSLGNTTNAEMLLSVGDYVDTQEVLNGGVTRNISIKVLDGTESWEKLSAGGTYRFGSTISDAITISGRQNVPITHFHYDASSHDLGVGFLATGKIFLYQNPDWTVEQFKQWLADQYTNGTPVIVAYPLATATTSSVSGQFLSKSPVTQTAGSISNLPIVITESSHTVPTPSQPLDIVSNNGVLKYNNNIVDDTITGQGTFVSPSTQSTRIYKYFGKLPSGNYTLSITGGFQFIVQYRDVDPPVAGMAYGNIGTWETSGTYALDNPDYFYGIAIRYPDNSNITPSDFNGTIALRPQFVYTDGTTETVEVTGKNLFNKDDDTSWGGWYSQNNVIATSPTANKTAVIRCKPNTTYYFKHCTYVGGLRAFYTEVENWEMGSPCSVTSGTVFDEPNTVYSITTSANAKWLFVLFGRSDNNVTTTFEEQESDYILSTEELTSATTYEPYYNGGTATAEMLLKVGDYKDTQEVLSGSVTRNIGIKVLDGTENWNYYSVTQGVLFRISISDSASNSKESLGVLCNCFKAASSINRQSGTLSGSSTNYDFIYDACDTVDKWKQFLTDQYNAGTPVIVVYPLAEPTTESVTGQPLTVQTGTNIVTITEASIDNLTMELSYKQKV